MTVRASSRHFWEVGWNAVDRIINGEFAVLQRVDALVIKDRVGPGIALHNGEGNA